MVVRGWYQTSGGATGIAGTPSSPHRPGRATQRRIDSTEPRRYLPLVVRVRYTYGEGPADHESAGDRGHRRLRTQRRRAAPPIGSRRRGHGPPAPEVAATGRPVRGRRRERSPRGAGGHGRVRGGRPPRLRGDPDEGPRGVAGHQRG